MLRLILIQPKEDIGQLRGSSSTIILSEGSFTSSKTRNKTKCDAPTYNIETVIVYPGSCAPPTTLQCQYTYKSYLPHTTQTVCLFAPGVDRKTHRLLNTTLLQHLSLSLPPPPTKALFTGLMFQGLLDVEFFACNYNHRATVIPLM